MKKKMNGTFILATTIISVLFIVVGGILLFKYRAGRVEPIQYKHQDKIDEKVWEMEPDENGKRHIVVSLNDIPDDEIPDNINPNSYADMKKLSDKYTDDFFKRNSIDCTDMSLVSWWGLGLIHMNAGEELIRKMAEDESVSSIFPLGTGIAINH